MRGNGKGTGKLLILFFSFFNLLKAKNSGIWQAQQQQRYNKKSKGKEKVLYTQKVFTTSV